MHSPATVGVNEEKPKEVTGNMPVASFSVKRGNDDYTAEF